MNANPFDQVGWSTEPSIPELLFRAWRRKEITGDEYYIGTASWVADNTQKYPPRPYPPIQDQARAYSRARVAADRPYDGLMHKKVGMWVAIMLKFRDQNSADFDLIVWSAKKCESVKLGEKVAALTSALKRFDAIRFPRDDFEAALASQKLDMEEKPKEARRA